MNVYFEVRTTFTTIDKEGCLFGPFKTKEAALDCVIDVLAENDSMVRQIYRNGDTYLKIYTQVEIGFFPPEEHELIIEIRKRKEL